MLSFRLASDLCSKTASLLCRVIFNSSLWPSSASRIHAAACDRVRCGCRCVGVCWSGAACFWMTSVAKWHTCWVKSSYTVWRSVAFPHWKHHEVVLCVCLQPDDSLWSRVITYLQIHCFEAPKKFVIMLVGSVVIPQPFYWIINPRNWRLSAHLCHWLAQIPSAIKMEVGNHS